MIGMIASVSLAGIVGTLLRFALGNWVAVHHPRHYYLATLAVNLVGCLIIGVLYGLFLTRPSVPAEVRVGLLVGFVGGLTTFSSFSLDTIRLLENGQAPLAFGYAAASVLGGLLATWAGLSLTRI